MATLKANGLQFDGGYGLSASKKTQTSGWFHYNWQNGTNVNYVGSWTGNTASSPDWNFPPRAMIFVYYYSPTRGDTNSWGGMYTNLFYNINGGSWQDCGHSGFVTRMRTDSYSITRHTGFAVFNMASQTSDFTMSFYINYRAYDSSGDVNGSMGLDSGSAGDRTGGNQNFNRNIIVTGYGVDS